ncbi:hypothetical protein DOY81_000392 [Sarcophaga bullata]|nr:hypothetical protein DOY81_000392 [Sarcophaga bullata]
MSSTQSDYFYGWDLLYKTIENVVNKKDDLLIALAHFVLTKHSQFRCIGIGDDKTLPEEEAGSGTELIPDNWNDDENNYALRYTNNKQLYILLGIRTEGSLIITLLDVKTRKVSNIGLDPEELVKATKGTITKMIPTATQLVERYRKELLEPVFAGTSKAASTQTSGNSGNPSSSSGPNSLRIGEPRRPPFGIYRPEGGLPDVGRGDLDPLGRGGSGNLFPFPSHPEFHVGPGGSFGPGAQPRFDPFAPPERGIRPNPNPDHLPPPGFGDYFM